MNQAGRSEARLSSPLTVLEGIGPKKAGAFAKLRVFTLEDIFFFVPRRYEDRRITRKLADITPGGNECAEVMISELAVKPGRTEAIVTDESDSVRAVWFSDKIGRYLREGMRLALYGPVGEYQMMPQFLHPEFEILKHPSQKPKITGKIFPVYPGSSDLPPKTVSRFVNDAITRYAAKCLKEFLPSSILTHYHMMSRLEAVLQIHSPADEMTFIRARNRLAFEELFLLQAGIMMRRNSNSTKTHSGILKPGEKFKAFTENLPFTLTNAQRRAIHEVLSDIERPIPMNRLLQGDVGSGKTLVAASAIVTASDSGAQSAFMAPTEILAQQHYLTLSRTLGPLGLSVALLSGGMKSSERRKVLEGLADGSIDIIVGTHALFSEGVSWKNLALVIVDEQHRFGVLQRNALISKGLSPHVLAMTATPIPRTLILSIYGELEVSVLDEMPPGRKKILTRAMTASEINELVAMIREQVREGHQVYWVCPSIEEGERELASVASTYERLHELMPELNISMIHGRLNVDDKSRIMNDFSAGEIDILIATVVIEVGVDVPNANMIVIDDAGQFGLAQLHQLRGRVGRGNTQSVCILIQNDNITPEGLSRLSAMVSSCDGFELAEQDLAQRGAGELCGTHQHGVTDFRVADLVRDEKILLLARDEARNLMANDPELSGEPELKREIVRRLGSVLELAVRA